MKRLTIAALLALLAGSAAAQHAHTGHGAGHDMGGAGVTEPGQGAFAAVAEVVATLRAAEGTDWSTVDIAALVAHLRDMNLAILGAEPTVRGIAGGLEIAIADDTPANRAAIRMALPHSGVLAAETGWRSSAVRTETGIVWRIEADREAEVDQIRALGFFGLLALGDHHPAHHLAMAKGQ